MINPQDLGLDKYFSAQNGVSSVSSEQEFLGRNTQNNTSLFNNTQYGQTIGSTIIDSRGIRSTTNFLIGGTTGLGTTVSALSTWGTIPNTNLGINLNRTQKVLLMGGGDFNVSKNDLGTAFSGYINAGFSIDGTVSPNSSYGVGDVANYVGQLGGFFHQLTSFQYVITLNAGSHNFNLIWEGVNSAGTSTISVENTYLNYIILGT